MRQINITRDARGVHFQEVSMDVTETVFFTNLDGTTAHWPALASNQLGPYPSPNSSECIVPPPAGNPPLPYSVTYGCKIQGHGNEQGTIKVFAQLAAGTTALLSVIIGTLITEQQVVKGGKSPYAISGQLFQIIDGSGKVILFGSDSIGPGLKLNPKTDNTGITVTGTPTQVGTYQFTFVVNDAMGRNLQQVQYSMKVTPPPVPPVVA